MKKIFFLSLFCASAGVSDAQTPIKAGTVQLGGSISYYQQHSEVTNAPSQNGDSQGFAISPSVGYFVANNLVVGINFGYSSAKTTNNNSSVPYSIEQRNHSIAIGPFVEYYQMLTEQFGLTGTLGINYVHSTFNGSGNNNNTESVGKGFYTGLTPGLVFFPISKLGIGASFGGLGYNHSNSKQDGDASTEVTSSSFSAIFGLNQLAFSGTYYFGR